MNNTVPLHPIYEYHGIPSIERPSLHEYCDGVKEVRLYQYEPLTFVDVSSLYCRHHVCLHTSTLMQSCKFCDFWSVSCEQSFMEMHFLGCHEDISPCINVSMKVMYVFKFYYIYKLFVA
jgi:hypothetical protein